MRIEAALLAGLALLPGGNAALSEEHRPESSHRLHHHHEAGALAAFHDLMEPLWHMPPGETRIEQTCARSTKIMGAADTVAAEPRGSDFDKAARGLQRSARLLRQACVGNDGPAVEMELSALHEYFHRLAPGGE